MDTFDIVIVGAGIAGASLAFRLQPHRRVLLLEREAQPGYHTTGRSAAMFMESYGPPGVRALTRASRRFYEAPPPGFADTPLLAPRGALYLATHGQEALLEATRRELAPVCPELRWLAAEEVTARVGCIRPEIVHAALLDPSSSDIDVHALHQGFLRGARRHGCELRLGVEPAQARRDAGDGWDLRLSDGSRLRAGIVVNAVGAWADTVARLFGAEPLGIEPRRRSAFTFEAPAGMDTSAWPAVVGVDESYYFKPDAGRLLGSPANADPTHPHDVMPEELDIAMGIDRIESVSTLRIRRPSSTWAGLRSFTPDGEMVIGMDGACPGFFWLAGQGGYGIQSAAGASALADALLRGIDLPEELREQGVDAGRLSPARFRRRDIDAAH